MDIGNNLKSFRLNHKLSRKRMCELTGVSAGYIEEIENSKKTPTIETLIKISSAFGITVSELIGESEPSLTPELKKLLDSARNMPPDQLQIVADLIEALNKRST